jgi:hypothetical protein
MSEAERLELQLKAYEPVIMAFESILLWRKPAVLAGLVLLVDSILFWAWISQAGIFSVFILGCLLTYIGVAVSKRLDIGRFFVASAKDAGELLSFKALCEKFAEGRKHLTMVRDYLLGCQFGHGALRILYVLAVWVTLAFVFNIIGRFWFFVLIWNSCLILPGFLLQSQMKQKID